MNEADRFNYPRMIVISLANRRNYAGELQFIDNEGSVGLYCKLTTYRKGIIISRAQTRADLKRNLYEMCVLQLDRGWHSTDFFSIEILNRKTSLN